MVWGRGQGRDVHFHPLVSVQREIGSERFSLTLELLLIPYIQKIWGSGEKRFGRERAEKEVTNGEEKSRRLFLNDDSLSSDPRPIC